MVEWMHTKAEVQVVEIWMGAFLCSFHRGELQWQKPRGNLSDEVKKLDIKMVGVDSTVVVVIQLKLSRKVEEW